MDQREVEREIGAEGGGAISPTEAVTNFATPEVLPHSHCEIHVKERNPLGSGDLWVFNGSMDLQPPPNAPAPPPTRRARRSRWWYHLLWGFGVISFAVMIAFGGLMLWDFKRHRARARGHSQKEAINNAREIHKALFELDVEYGEFPSASTMMRVREDTETTMSLGTVSSNAYFRQLLAMGLGNEKMFYSGSRKFRKPDDLFDGVKALQKGECGFAYVVGLSTSDNSSMPLVIAPVIPSANRFDPDAFDGKAVVLRIDGSAVFYPIQTDGKIDLGKGDLLDPAKPEWNGKPLTIAWPE